VSANSPAGAPKVRIYIDARAVDAESGATPLLALEGHDHVAAALVREGSRIIVDNRGLPAPLDEPVTNGSIFRVVSSKQAS
jgi:hypothetical protein